MAQIFIGGPKSQQKIEDMKSGGLNWWTLYFITFPKVWLVGVGRTEREAGSGSSEPAASTARTAAGTLHSTQYLPDYRFINTANT